MACPKCKTKCLDHVRSCHVCGENLGFPNVRAAQKLQETDALTKRYDSALRDADARGCRGQVDSFGDAVKDSKAVVCRPLSVVQKLVSSDNELYSTFYQLVRGESRLPEDNEMDLAREPIDATLFPHYHEEIRFAALTLDGRGVSAYGECAIVLSTLTIEHRATVFQENSVQFFRQTVPAWRSAPPGHRAAWTDRHRLAVAKLGSRIDVGTTFAQFAGILLSHGSDLANADFIEVHVYGPLHRRGIERVVAPEPKRRQDRTILADLRRKLSEVGAHLETGK
jgi:hypothetical protein